MSAREAAEVWRSRKARNNPGAVKAISKVPLRIPCGWPCVETRFPVAAAFSRNQSSTWAQDPKIFSYSEPWSPGTFAGAAGPGWDAGGTVWGAGLASTCGGLSGVSGAGSVVAAGALSALSVAVAVDVVDAAICGSPQGVGVNFHSVELDSRSVGSGLGATTGCSGTGCSGTGCSGTGATTGATATRCSSTGAAFSTATGATTGAASSTAPTVINSCATSNSRANRGEDAPCIAIKPS